MTMKKRDLEKKIWKKEKMLVTSFFSFSHIVFYPITVYFMILPTFKFSSTNAFNLDKFNILLFAEELWNHQIHVFENMVG